MAESHIFFILSVPVFILIWLFIGKFSDFLAHVLKQLKENETNIIDRALSQLLNVFSAETANGKEAEFIDEHLPDRNKIARFFRIILIGLYLLIIIYWLMFTEV